MAFATVQDLSFTPSDYLKALTLVLVGLITISAHWRCSSAETALGSVLPDASPGVG
jgi:hypothetical protein